MGTLLELGLGMLRLRDARDSGRTKVEGDADARARWTSMLRGFRA
jgi:hypothetical protein